MSLPKRRFYPIAELAEAWATTTGILIDYAVDRKLEICVQVFGVRVDQFEGTMPGQTSNRPIKSEVLVGVQPLLPADLWQVRCHGIARARRFACRDEDQLWFQSTEDQADVEITVAALLVTSAERDRFERQYELIGECPEPDAFIHSFDYRSITLNGRQFILSTTRAKLVAVLHDAWRRGAPWVEKDALLQAANSGGSRVADVFTDTDERQCILVADKRGNWRINLPLPPVRKTAFRRANRQPHLTLVKS